MFFGQNSKSLRSTSKWHTDSYSACLDLPTELYGTPGTIEWPGPRPRLRPRSNPGHILQFRFRRRLRFFCSKPGFLAGVALFMQIWLFNDFKYLWSLEMVSQIILPEWGFLDYPFFFIFSMLFLGKLRFGYQGLQVLVHHCLGKKNPILRSSSQPSPISLGHLSNLYVMQIIWNIIM